MKIQETLEKVKNLPLGTHYLVFLISTLGGSGIGWIGFQLPGDGMNNLILLGMIMAITSLLWWIFFLKYPYCGRHLIPRAGFPNYCPRCGEKLT